MIRVLKSWDEIKESYWFLTDRHLPLHQGIGKLWDFKNIAEFFQVPQDPDSPIIDLGCGMGIPGRRTIDLLFPLGYRHLVGIDLGIPHLLELQTRVTSFLRPHFRKSTSLRLLRRNITNTGLPAEHFQHAICLSVIEHGLFRELGRFFSEVARLIKPGGLLYLSTDYWPTKVMRDGTLNDFPWRIFSSEEITELCEIARQNGLKLLREDHNTLEEPNEKVVYYGGQKFTFIAMVLHKAS